MNTIKIKCTWRKNKMKSYLRKGGKLTLTHNSMACIGERYIDVAIALKTVDVCAGFITIHDNGRAYFTELFEDGVYTVSPDITKSQIEQMVLDAID